MSRERRFVERMRGLTHEHDWCFQALRTGLLNKVETVGVRNVILNGNLRRTKVNIRTAAPLLLTVDVPCSPPE